MSERFSRAQLFGAAVNVVSEMPESDLLAADTLKAIISGDTIEVERKHQDPFSFTPRAAHIFAANKLPASRDRSHGLWRRLVPVEFCTVFTAETRDPQLISALRAEFDLIVPWALECARGYITRGRRFAHADRINAWRGAWRADTDATAGYLAEMLETVTDHKDGETAETLWRAFQRWADDQGLEHAKKTALKTFGSHLRALPGVTKKSVSVNGKIEARYNLKRKDTTDKPAPMWK
jgi:putative DNA primase/helicase